MSVVLKGFEINISRKYLIFTTYAALYANEGYSVLFLP